MILELDCGNTLIKWRLFCSISEVATPIQHVALIEDLIPQLMLSNHSNLECGRLVSVRSAEETQYIVDFLQQRLGITITVAKPARVLAGVTNGYEDFNQLGMDRWLAVVAAYQLVKGACLIFDLGTAVTVDFVTTEGFHLGGFITPGLPMLKDQLLKNTRRVRYTQSEVNQSLVEFSPGVTTGQAVEQGCFLMLRSYIEYQLQEANRFLGSDFSVLVTGGDSALFSELAKNDIQVVSDLVFKGLKLACN